MILNGLSSLLSAIMEVYVDMEVAKKLFYRSRVEPNLTGSTLKPLE